MSDAVIQTHPTHLSIACPTTDSDSSSPAGINAVIPLSQQHKDIHQDLVQEGTTTRNQRTIPSRSNTKNSLITMSFRFIWFWITKQILASVLENLCHALLSQQKCHHAAKQVTTRSTGISNSANKIISANNHLPVSLIFLFSVLALPPLAFFPYYLIHILILPTLLYSSLSVLFSLYLYGFLSA